MFKSFFFALSLIVALSCHKFSSDRVGILSDQTGHTLLVNGEAFFIKGINWDYYPRGTSYTYSLWEENDTIIKAALHNEMTLLRDMGVNALRIYTGIPPKWVAYIYENYGIYTMINHPFGRYGLQLEGHDMANTEYGDERVKRHLLEEAAQLAQKYRDTPGILLYLLGNENNFGLFWGGAETEDIPVDDTLSRQRAIEMYRLMNAAAKTIHTIDAQHPVALCNGDLLFLDLIVKECPDINIIGTNMYRGHSFGDAFSRVKEESGKAILFTEFGADAFNALTNQEDQAEQVRYLLENWKEIYKNAAGLGLSENCIGGFTFQFSDGWWKFGQKYNLDVHDTQASWSNGGYTHDYREGHNNMNEEWFGVCAKGETDGNNLYLLQPRNAFYTLRDIHRADVFTDFKQASDVNSFFENIKIEY